jgi:hypothetical protein
LRKLPPLRGFRRDVIERKNVKKTLNRSPNFGALSPLYRVETAKTRAEARFSKFRANFFADF